MVPIAKDLSGEELSILLDYSQDTVAILDEDGFIQYVSPAVESITGFEPGELVGRNAFELMHPADSADVWEQFRTLLAAPGEETDRVVHRQQHTDGSWVWVESIGSNQTHTALNGYVFSSRDISGRKSREVQLENYKEYTEEILDSFEDGFFVIDTNGDLLRWNQVVTDKTGYSEAQMQSLNAADFLPPAQANRVVENLREAMETGHARFEADLVGTDTDPTPYEFVATRLENPDGETVIAGIGRDITTRKRREEELGHYKRAVEGASDLIAAIDTDYGYLFANPAYRAAHGIEDVELDGKHISDVLPRDEWKKVRAYVERAMSGEEVRVQVTRELPDGIEAEFDILYYPLQSPDGQLDGVGGTVRDVTEMRKRETHLRALDRMLRHNLRNELNIILGTAATIATSGPPAYRDQAQTIVDAAERLMEQGEKERKIIDVLADPSNPIDVDVAAVVRQAAESLGSAHDAVQLAVSAPEKCVIRSIPEIDVAVRELVENAIHHAEADSAAIELGVKAVDDTVRIRVQDSNPPIPGDELRVVRGESEIEPLLHSSGMGLWMVTRIIERAGGQLEFETGPDGNVVTVTLPRGL